MSVSRLERIELEIRDLRDIVDRMAAKANAQRFLLVFAMGGRPPTPAEIAEWAALLPAPSEGLRVIAREAVEEMVSLAAAVQRGHSSNQPG